MLSTTTNIYSTRLCVESLKVQVYAQPLPQKKRLNLMPAKDVSKLIKKIIKNSIPIVD